MRKKLHLLTTLFVMMICANSVWAQSVTINGVTYSWLSAENCVGVTDCDSTLTNVTIEGSVEINGLPYNVTKICSAAFNKDYWNKSNNNLLEVTLPNTITVIQSYAFRNCTALESVTLSNSLSEIGEHAFYGTDILSMELPASITNIDYNAFSYKTIRLTCNATTPPTLGNDYNGNTYTLGNISVVYVPVGCRSAYTTVWPWSSKSIIDGQGVSVNVKVTPGMMGEEILKQTNYLANVNHLTISGSINEDDINNIKNSMPNLLSIDMSGLDMKEIPSHLFAGRKPLQSVILPKNVEIIQYGAFYDCHNLESIVMPEGLKNINSYSGSNGSTFSNCYSLKSIVLPTTLESIGEYAFNGCSRISKMTIPKGVKTIGSGAFGNCTKLKKVTFEDGIEEIGYYSNGVFSNCYALEEITLPKTLKTIGENTFSYCTKLSKVEFPEGLQRIMEGAFCGCTSLTKITLPSTLSSCGVTPFAGCTNLKEINCLSLFPPVLEDALLTLNDMGQPLQRTLNVPEWTLSKYKLTSGWAAFSEILPIANIYPNSINVHGRCVLEMPTTPLPANYTPDMTLGTYSGVGASDEAIYTESSLHFKGTGTLQLNRLTYPTLYSQLLCEPDVTAKEIEIYAQFTGQYWDSNSGNNRQKWYFISFPFDVNLADVITQYDWVVRQYDGEARAKANYSNTWVNVPQNGMLNAGQGYIWACSGGYFPTVIKAADNANKNLIFANTKREIPLKEYASEHVANSSWNLIGNPYPCYYNIQHMDYTAPITVWDENNKTYAAYSPVDDNYNLHPFEAFFVQKPANVDKIGFEVTGRQLTDALNTTNPVSTARPMSKNSDRYVINIELSNDHYTDRTRLVINKEAQMVYELERDAAKFMSTDATMQQIYTIYNDEMFSINERPIGDGIVMIGTQFAKAGTYTIAMQSTSEMAAILVDKKNGKEIDLNVEEYTFEAEATDTNRFSVRLYNKDNATAVETVKNKTEISCAGNTIIVAGSADANVEVYNMAGALVASGRGDNFTFNAESGVYIVKVNGTAKKVAVGK